MENMINRKQRLELEKLKLPKHFEFKVFGKVVDDLVAHVDESMYTSRFYKLLRDSLTLSQKVIRSRDVVQAATLGGSIDTQSILNEPWHTAQDAEAFFVLYQLGAFLKKFPFKGIDTAQSAYEKFFKAENLCKLYNTENHQAVRRLSSTCHWLYGNCIDEIRSDIETLLGEAPDLACVEECAGHGPGVSLSENYKHGESTAYFKWAYLPYSVTLAALPMAKRVIQSDVRWLGALEDWYRTRTGDFICPLNWDDFWSRVFEIVPGSRITTVPKTALTDRTIAIEPLVNVYLQLGVDKVIKKALKYQWSIDLTKQEVNQKLAQEGAKHARYATLDLSMASDLISLEVCKMLLPDQWYDLMLDLRSPQGVIAGTTISFEKMSSMGNGFTFALESLLFTAVCRHVYRRMRLTETMAVYGDDIIIATAASTHVIDLLQLFGFRLNTDKSFTAGPFRESCGSDWFLGYNVRPVFLTRRMRTVLDLYYAHNRLWELERNVDWTWGLEFKRTRKFLRKYIPKKYGRIVGPPGEMLDSHLFVQLKTKRDWHFAIVARPRLYNRGKGFFFRKLMAPLKPPSHDDDPGDIQSRINRVVYGLSNQTIREAWLQKDRKISTHAKSGNAFDVTKRDHVYYKCTKKRIWY